MEVKILPMNDITENTNMTTSKCRKMCNSVPKNGLKSCLKARGPTDKYLERDCYGDKERGSGRNDS